MRDCPRGLRYVGWRGAWVRTASSPIHGRCAAARAPLLIGGPSALIVLVAGFDCMSRMLGREISAGVMVEVLNESGARPTRPH